MRKKLLIGLFAAAAVLLLANACTREEFEGGAKGDTATVTFGLGVQNAASTRAISDGTTADKLYYAVYDKDGNYVTSEWKTAPDDFDGFPTQVTLTLAVGQQYEIAFWAQNSACSAFTIDTDPDSNDYDPRTLTIDYSGLYNNDETFDAFFAADTITVTRNTVESITLKRPFAQVNVGATQEDWEAAEGSA
ncbi:MAG: hypothetical protein LUI02_04385, partial [Clostridiales bacterium]|nr:hypothetical protein [Clostridiales bacterium]